MFFEGWPRRLKCLETGLEVRRSSNTYMNFPLIPKYLIHSPLKWGFAPFLDHVCYGWCRPIYRPSVDTCISTDIACEVSSDISVERKWNSVKCVWDIGEVLVEYRPSVGRITVKCRWNVGVVGMLVKCRLWPVVHRCVWPFNCRYLGAVRSHAIHLHDSFA